MNALFIYSSCVNIFISLYMNAFVSLYIHLIMCICVGIYTNHETNIIKKVNIKLIFFFLFTHAHDLLRRTWKYYVYLFMVDAYIFSLTKHLICGYLLNEVCNESDFYFRFYKKSRLIRFCVFFLDIFSFSLG